MWRLVSSHHNLSPETRSLEQLFSTAGILVLPLPGLLELQGQGNGHPVFNVLARGIGWPTRVARWQDLTQEWKTRKTGTHQLHSLLLYSLRLKTRTCSGLGYFNIHNEKQPGSDPNSSTLSLHNCSLTKLCFTIWNCLKVNWSHKIFTSQSLTNVWYGSMFC